MTTTSHRRARARTHTTMSTRRTLRRAAGGALVVSAVALGTAGPAAAAPSVTVSPDRNLTDTATVNVSGAGFSAGATVLLYQCADVGFVGHCTDQPLAELETSLSGAFDPVAVGVQAVFVTDLGSTECRTGCRIEVVQQPGIGFGQDTISFSRYSSTK